MEKQVFKFRAISKKQVDFVGRNCRTEPILTYVMQYFSQELTLQSLHRQTEMIYVKISEDILTFNYCSSDN